MIRVPRINGDVVLAVLVVAVTAMLLVPLPTPLLDVLIVMNLASAIVLLVVGLYMPNTLALLAFPSLLLLTTLFRLSLNVASTRLILGQADAGQVIASFGTFLIRGELVVGIIIFLIITIVNFIVIARGASRVSEVAARFALDALPGKQMAIDADLRAGLLSPEEAQSRREDLRKESQLYGAMDGAMKFVQGDAIAGLFIIGTNLFGGVYLGLSHGMSFSEAAHTYSVLTVGDGLVSQIPALLISICAGIVVTRVSSGENATLGMDVGQQIFSRPAALVFAGVLILAAGALPDVPKVPFWGVGSSLLIAAWALRRSLLEQALSPDVRSITGRDATSALGTRASTLSIGTTHREESGHEEGALRIQLDSAVLYRGFRAAREQHREWWRKLQSDHISEVGLRLPDLQVFAGTHLRSGEYEIIIGDAILEHASVPLDCIVGEVSPAGAEALGLSIEELTSHPLSFETLVWVRDSLSSRRILEVAEIRTWNFFEWIGLRASAVVARFPEEFFGVTDSHVLLKQIEKKFPGLVADSFDRSFFTVPRITDIVRELLREGFLLKDLRSVIEAGAHYLSSYSGTPLRGDEFELQDVVAFIRKSKSRQRLSRLLSSRGTLKVIELGTASDKFPHIKDHSGAVTGIRASDTTVSSTSVSRPLLEAIDQVALKGLGPISLLCAPEFRVECVTILRRMAYRLG